MKNINRYKIETRLIKDAMHWPLTNLDNEYAKQRNRKITHRRKMTEKKKMAGRLGDLVTWGIGDLVMG